LESDDSFLSKAHHKSYKDGKINTLKFRKGDFTEDYCLGLSNIIVDKN